MVDENECNCPNCSGLLKPYDTVYRIVRTKGGVIKRVKIGRYVCVNCGRVHRALPNYILPFKHYEHDIIEGVINGYISYDTLGYEDYPCETTMIRWHKRNIQGLL